MYSREFRPAPIAVTDRQLVDLKHRLRNTRWPSALPYRGWSAGANLDYIKELCSYWAETFDWRTHEAWFNSFRPFLVSVDGLDLHVWKVNGRGEKPIPLLLLHGWPGSVAEFRQVLEALATPGVDGVSFDVVMPSLPGFGFGGKPTESGWGVTRSAEALHNLMSQKLGYSTYGVQGGDWGAVIGAKLSSLHPESIVGFHSNMPLFGWQFDPEEMGKDLSAEDQRKFDRASAFVQNERGYSIIQSTKPMSLAIAQTDSPAGLCAWVVEKMQTWSDVGDDLEAVYTKDEIITNVMFYWASDSVASAAALYYESRRDTDGTTYPPIGVPVGLAAFPKEIFPASRRWIESMYTDIRQWTELPRGGHFAAFEQPELWLGDVKSFFGQLRG